MNLKIIYILANLFFCFSFISCQQAMHNHKKELQKVSFEEYNHVNLNLIRSETKILTSQEDIDKIYFKINDNNPSPRKSPIPAYTETEIYIVVQPKISKSDFTVTEVREDGENLEIKIEEFDNTEFINKKHPASIIRIDKKNNYKEILLKK